MNLIKTKNIDLAINQAVMVIKSGGIVVAPFDTVYGFICDPYNDNALEKIFELKGRDTKKTVGLATFLSPNIHQLVDVKFKNFIDDKIPGPYTFVLPLLDKKISKYCQRNDAVAVRVPDSDLILSISKSLGHAIAQTSANKSGQSACASIEDLGVQFSNTELDSIDLIIDGGAITDATPSRIFDLTADVPREIVR